MPRVEEAGAGSRRGAARQQCLRAGRRRAVDRVRVRVERVPWRTRCDAAVGGRSEL